MSRMTSDIFTDAVSLARKIDRLQKDGQDFQLDIVEGVYGEKVVKISYKANYWEDED